MFGCAGIAFPGVRASCPQRAGGPRLFKRAGCPRSRKNRPFVAGLFHAPGSLAAPMRGFTLLELVVVLLLMALVTALAMPNLERLYAGLTRTTERDYILDQFVGLGRQAMLQGRPYVVLGTEGAPQADPPGSERETTEIEPRGSPARPAGPAGGPPPAGRQRYVIDLPEGWEIRLDEPLVVRANGVCLGGELTLYHRGAVDVRLGLEPPYCRIDAGA